MNHGMSKTRFYTIWHHMKQRCQNEGRKDFHLYGGRGIVVCESWKDFVVFKNDMYQSYLEHVNEYGEKDTTLDRINTNGHYEPSNCRWATQIEQLGNRRSYKGGKHKPHKPHKPYEISSQHKQIKKFVAFSPNNEMYLGASQGVFAKEHNLTKAGINGCLRGIRKTHKGWKFKYIENEA